MSTQRREGLLGGLIGAVVGASVEYHHHRKQKAAVRSAPAEREAVAGPLSHPDASRAPPSEQLSPYSDDQDSFVAARPSASHEKKILPDDGDIEFDSEYSDSLSDLSTEDDEEAWKLDELAASNEPPSYENAISNDQSADALVRDVFADRAMPTVTFSPLPLPVIIPQRRPRNKSRGFVRVYAPVLENVGIDQDTFLKFLKSFHAASQANPLFNAVIVAANIASMAPSAIAMAVSISVQVVASVGKEIDCRRKTNTFLDRMNEEFFKPAGCYAMVVKYKSDQEVANAGADLLGRFGVGSEKVDFSSLMAVAKYDTSPTAETPARFASKLRTLRPASGETRGSIQMPEAAPLIYPAIDSALAGNKNETFKDKARDAKKFLASYADRRAQIAYARNDADSKLNLPEQERQLQSKWSDPDHPMFNNGLIGLVSGGLLRPDALKTNNSEWKRREMKYGWKSDARGLNFDRRLQRDEMKQIRNYQLRPEEADTAILSGLSPRMERRGTRMLGRNENSEGKLAKQYGPQVADDRSGDYCPGSSSRYDSRRSDGRPKQGLLSGVRKLLQQDVLYLMIVPMPSDSELREARAALGLAGASTGVR